ncbi:DUF1212-domain-containing protein [Peniophora sp. CONT]|nr:DUF1212-domain-containing protein [Peniophora sp. CONT]
MLRQRQHRGLQSEKSKLWNIERGADLEDLEDGRYGSDETRIALPVHSRRSSIDSAGSLGYDDDDPRVTGIKREQLDDEVEREAFTRRSMALKNMSYRERKKEAAKMTIQYNVTSIINRRKFIIKLARALMTFSAPSHRIEMQLSSAARVLELEAEFVHLPSIILVSFGDPEYKTSETHFVKCSGSLALGSLHDVHQIYRKVVHDEISAKEAAKMLQKVLDTPPIYSRWLRSGLAFMLSALICPLAFGGSFVDMWLAGTGAVLLSFLQSTVASKSLYENVFEITVAMLISFAARGLSSIPSQIFCYTAVSSASIIGILPGYLILSSSLEMASKNILTGSVKMVYALIYTLFLGFGLQIGSDIFLLFDPHAREFLKSVSSSGASIVYSGQFVADNGTLSALIPLNGTFTFQNDAAPGVKDLIEGCYRPSYFPWFKQPFPFWTQFIIVPLFSIGTSLGNLQPWKSRDLVVMVLISCASYTANKAANHYIFGRSDVVSAIGAFVCGLLGNMYSRRFGGTGFQVMVSGVLFLVPSGLSQAGGITANGNGIEIGAAMIAVTIGITVGLFMSQALVYAFGSRKKGAIFSF